VDVYARTLTEQNAVFNEHCETNGSIKASSASMDLSIPVKAFKIGFSGSQQESRKEMQNFCKSYAVNIQRFDSTYRLSSSVVTDALRSFNQCVELERSSVRISHASTPVRSVVVRVDLNPATTQVALRSVRYDAKVAECTTTIAGPSPVLLNSSWNEQKASGPFAVVCDRKAELVSGGETRFSRFELLVDTNHGPYTVVMPAVSVLGYDLASANEKRAAAAAVSIANLNSDLGASRKESSDLKAELNALKTKMSGLRATSVHSVLQGDGAPWACNVNPETASVAACRAEGSERLTLHKTPERNGRSCGYREWRFACVQYP
jgi:hypothetical protein